MHIEDVTEATKARPDAHPLKPHDRLMRLEYKGGVYHVKVRVTRHRLSSELFPQLHLTASHADETGKAKVLANGKVDVLRGWDTTILTDPGDRDAMWTILLMAECLAKRAVRAHDAFDILSAHCGEPVLAKPVAPVDGLAPEPDFPLLGLPSPAIG